MLFICSIVVRINLRILHYIKFIKKPNGLYIVFSMELSHLIDVFLGFNLLKYAKNGLNIFLRKMQLKGYYIR